MECSIAQTKRKKSSPKRRDVLNHALPRRSDLVERRIRQLAAWIILCLLLLAELGLAWDRQWHDRLGRDQFWIPPHIMMYTGLGCTGLIALFVVLLDTVRYYQKKPGVDDSSTITVLRYFHAPLGFILLGFGTLTDLIAAPFDNYWHQLYGVDVTLWTPFHLMGALGAIMAGLGVIYAFASEAVHEREFDSYSERVSRSPEPFPFAAPSLRSGLRLTRAAAHSLEGKPREGEGSANGESPRFFAALRMTFPRLRMAFPSSRFLGINGPQWALIVLLAAFQEFILPALTAFTPISLGDVMNQTPTQILTYPLILVVGASICLISIVICIRKPGVTLLTVLVLGLLSLLTEIFVPLALRFMAAQLGLSWRFGFAPVFNLTLALLPLFSLLCAFIVELVVYLQRQAPFGHGRTKIESASQAPLNVPTAAGKKENGALRGAWLLGAIFAVPAVVMPPGIVYLISHFAPFITLPPDVIRILEPGGADMLLSIPCAMIVGAVLAYIGSVLGDIWYWNKQ